MTCILILIIVYDLAVKISYTQVTCTLLHIAIHEHSIIITCTYQGQIKNLNLTSGLITLDVLNVFTQI